MKSRPVVALTATACLSVLAVTTAAPAAAKPAGPKPVDVQLLAFNDFHGALTPPSGSGGRVSTGATTTVDAGGAAYFATHLRQQEAENKDTLTISNGDLIGGSPFLSALFRDEPTVEAMNLLGLDIATVGNHEFDEGVAELRRVIDGGACHPIDGCLDGDGYAGSDADWLAANVVDRRTQQPILPPYEVRKVRGVEIGVIGAVLEGTPSIVSAAGIADVQFLDEIQTINRYVAELQRQGVETIVVSLHEGGSAGTDVNGCTNPTGPAFDITRGISDAVDVVMTGHSHSGYVCEGANEVDGKLVTQALSNGRLITDIDLSIDRRSGDVVAAAAENVVVTRDVAPAADVQALVDRYAAIAAPIANEPVGDVTADITRAQEPLYGAVLGESSLGNLIADAQLAATDDEAGAVAAFMNPGGVRADLLAGEVTYGEAFEVQPFNNLLTTLDLTGAQLYALLDQQFTLGRVLAPSASVAYTVDDATGTVVPGSLTIGGVAVDPAGTYRITVNNFLAGGGDGFTVLTQGTDVENQPGFDVDALIAYLAGEPVAPPATDRITVG
ncbi:5'-nucleotidase [Geodermatophilus obscurus]|uniref:5'-nucleotidase n=1 Tax=Geodermatophilus obscurus TaxID=1861 RepID=A0A1I5CJR0_9ACTN|nr:bifunctional metallophosphatase/5'-nucleotidase [Geodermatophilus obscurus]SFN87137.1 5'-nucleotidase [Geodermatophilus obscurus]